MIGRVPDLIGIAADRGAGARFASSEVPGESVGRWGRFAQNWPSSQLVTGGKPLLWMQEGCLGIVSGADFLEAGEIVGRGEPVGDCCYDFR